jgi:putative ABC transport system permease protein
MFYPQLNNQGMIKSYFKIATRNLIKNRIYTGINIIGLAVSLTVFVLIMLYVNYELSYDKFFPDAERIYKLVTERKYPSHTTYYSGAPASWAKVIEQDFPEVEKAIRLFGGPYQQFAITVNTSDHEVKTFEERFYFQADSSFFDFFKIDLIKGNKKTALSRPHQVILSQTTAKRYFGQEEPIGKILGGDLGEMIVAGVFKDIPENSHMRIDLLSSLGGPQFDWLINRVSFTSFDTHTYVKLRQGANPKSLEAKFPKMVDHYVAAEVERDLGQSWKDYTKAGNGYVYMLQPLTSIHLDPAPLEFTIKPSGSSTYINALILIAVLILVIACINFINLATARSMERAREVGVRKVMGSLRGQLILQFLTEAILISFVGIFLSTITVFLLLPYFNNLVERPLHLVLNVQVILGLIGFALFVGTLAGIYPAIALSGYKPIVAMKGNFSTGSKGSWLRNVLVTFQFATAIILIAGTMVVSQQTNFMQNKNLGFDKEQVLMVKRGFDLGRQTESFISEIQNMSEVQSAAATSTMVGNRDDVYWSELRTEGSSEILTTLTFVIDDNFTTVMGFELSEGKMFDKETNDSLHVLVNEAAVKVLGLANPVGKNLSLVKRHSKGNITTTDFKIAGVIKNFHFQSLRDKISPLVIFSKERFGKESTSNYIAIRLKSGSIKAAIGRIETLWSQFVPGHPFHYEFLDDYLNHLYAREELSRKIFMIFSTLAIIIACVGLFGLSAYAASRRTKEIGIRKVLGSSVARIFILLSRDFAKVVVIAFAVAVPLSWVVMNNWLNSFTYRIDLGPGLFIASGLLAFIIALLTVSYHCIKAALTNPVNSLRSE